MEVDNRSVAAKVALDRPVGRNFEENTMDWLKKLIAQYKRRKREREVLDTCGCVTFCPHCGDILNDNSVMLIGDDVTGTYRCKACDGVSPWHFGAPVPILVTPNAEGNKPPR